MGNFCMECGAKLSPEDKFCPSCGHKLIVEEAQIKSEFQSNTEAKINQAVDSVAPAVKSVGNKVSEACTFAADMVERKYDETRYKINTVGSIPPVYRDFGKGLLLSVITLGIYALYWQYMFVKDLQKIAGEDSIRDYIPAVLIGIVTFGLYMIYYQYKMGKAVNDAQNLRRMPGVRYDFGKLMIIIIIACVASCIVTPLVAWGITIYYYKKLIEEYNKVIDFDNRGF